LPPTMGFLAANAAADTSVSASTLFEKNPVRFSIVKFLCVPFKQQYDNAGVPDGCNRTIVGFKPSGKRVLLFIDGSLECDCYTEVGWF